MPATSPWSAARCNQIRPSSASALPSNRPSATIAIGFPESAPLDSQFRASARLPGLRASRNPNCAWESRLPSSAALRSQCSASSVRPCDASVRPRIAADMALPASAPRRLQCIPSSVFPCRISERPYAPMALECPLLAASRSQTSPSSNRPILNSNNPAEVADSNALPWITPSSCAARIHHSRAFSSCPARSSVTAQTQIAGVKLIEAAHRSTAFSAAFIFPILMASMRIDRHEAGGVDDIRISQILSGIFSLTSLDSIAFCTRTSLTVYPSKEPTVFAYGASAETDPRVGSHAQPVASSNQPSGARAR